MMEFLDAKQAKKLVAEQDDKELDSMMEFALNKVNEAIAGRQLGCVVPVRDIIPNNLAKMEKILRDKGYEVSHKSHVWTNRYDVILSWANPKTY